MEFVLLPDRKVQEFSHSLLEEFRANNVEVTDSTGSVIAGDSFLGSIMRRSFWITIDEANKIHVLPNIYNILPGGEEYREYCESLGISQFDTTMLCRFAADLHNSIQEEFSREELLESIDK
jgi:hypothetical protein